MNENLLWLLFLLLAGLIILGIVIFRRSAQKPKALESKPKPELEIKTELKPSAELKAKPELSLKAEPAAKIEAKKPLEPEARPKPKVAPKTEAPPQPKIEPEATRAPGPKVEPKIEPAPQPKAEPEVTPAPEPKAELKSLGSALSNTRGGFMAKLARLFSRTQVISDEDFEEMEAILFTADIGAKTAQRLLDSLRERVSKESMAEARPLQDLLKEEMRKILKAVPKKELALDEKPAVFMFVGVNGAGKTTSIGKLGAQLSASGKKVVFGAGDTFRAAAVKQLSIWGERSGIQVVTGKENADSASVLFESIQQAKQAGADVVLCDTAGRLHTKVELMDELKKVSRVIGKAQPRAPHEVFLVIDATMGQNAIAQAREFAEATLLTGVVLSKLDGTAKGGVALGIVAELGIPIRFIGIGEQIGDLRPFDADEFVDALFENS
jgi:fused signal recognition particle receptor